MKKIVEMKKKRNFPNGKKIVKEILSIPVHEKLTIKEIRYVVKNINEFYENLLIRKSSI